MTRYKGITLIELMITLAVIAILGAVAWPLFEDQLAKQRRSDAVTALTTASSEMENCRATQGTASYLKQDGSDCSPAENTSKNGYYAITSQVTNGGQGYLLTATRTTTDADCASLTLDHLGRKGHTGDAANARRCWGD